MIDPRGPVSLGLALLLAAFAGCSSGSNTPSNPTPTNIGAVNIVPPLTCVPVACLGNTINSIIITGPEIFAPFDVTFTITNRLPFVLPGSYTLSDSSFVDSTGATTGCPAVGFTVATAKTTTVTFSITRDVCSITVAGPA